MKQITVIVFLMLSVALASGADLLVPSQYQTIQDAIDDCNNGDTVIVADDIYTDVGNREIDFLGKEITVRSKNGPTKCVIDCQYSSRAFYFHNNETSNSALEGFTIQNGLASNGAGIYCDAASPTINNCIINGNRASFGGGIYCSNGSPVITNCTVSYNSAEQSGAGMFFSESAPSITSCKVLYNSINADNGNDAKGGGIYYESDQFSTIKHCVIRGNTVWGSEEDMMNPGQPLWDAGDGLGGGIYNDSFGATVQAINCLIIENDARRGEGMIHYGYGHGGGVYCDDWAEVEFLNCTIVDNEAEDGGGVYGREMGLVRFFNSILWGNQVNQMNWDCCAGGEFSDIEGGLSGLYNIDMDPLFTDGPLGSYYLSQIAAGQDQNSPCVNTASYLITDPEIETLTTRTDHINDEFSPYLTCDMGYHYLPKRGDISGDGCVNLIDFAYFAAQWNNIPDRPLILSADIVPDGGDGIVNIEDIGGLTCDWLAGVE